MTLESLINLVKARIAYVSAQRNAAERIGDIELVARLDGELAECEATLGTLLNS
jgi:hypothetical protein